MSSAEYHQEHRDDPDEWEDEPEEPVRRSDTRLSSMISARFEPEEVDRLRAAAQRDGLTQSAFIRQAVLEACEPGRLDAPWSNWSRTLGSGDVQPVLYGSAVSDPVTVIGVSIDTEIGSGDRRGPSVLIRR